MLILLVLFLITILIIYLIKMKQEKLICNKSNIQFYKEINSLMILFYNPYKKNYYCQLF